LVPALQALQAALQQKAVAFHDVIKTGRTHLMDATPIRLGQEFAGYAGQVQRAIRRLRYAQQELSEVPLGGTAVGTGINAHPEFAARAWASCGCPRSNRGPPSCPARSTRSSQSRSSRYARRCRGTIRSWPWATSGATSSSTR